MANNINRHKSTRWVANQATSYGEEWGDMGEYEEDTGSISEGNVESSYTENQEATSATEPQIDDMTEKLANTLNVSNSTSGDAINEPPADNKRSSRFFVTNPDLSDSETEIDPPESHWQSQESIPVGSVNSNDDPENNLEAEEQRSSSVEADSFEDIVPTKPLKVRSKASSRNPSVDLKEMNNDTMTTDRKEKLMSKDYSNIDLVMDDYLSKRDSQFYKEDDAQPQFEMANLDNVAEDDEEAVAQGADALAQREEEYFEGDYKDNDIDHDHSYLDSNHASISNENDLSVTPNDYSLGRSVSSGSLSTGSWSARSSTHFINASFSARDSFLNKAQSDRRPSISSNTVVSSSYTNSELGPTPTEKNTYMDDSSSEDEITQAQSINFGQWRPSTSQYRKAFIKDVNNDAASSIMEDDEYDDGRSMMTDQSSLNFADEENRFFTKPLDEVAEEADGGIDDDDFELDTSQSGEEASRRDSHNTIEEDTGDITETEIATEEEKDDDQETDVEDDSYQSNEYLAPTTTTQQRYSSLLSDTSEAPTTRQVSGTSQRLSRVSSSQQTVSLGNPVVVKTFTPFNFKEVQQLTNPESRINELRRMRKEEAESNTGLQDWLSAELSKENIAPDSYDTLGPITLNAYKKVTPTTHLHSHSVTDMITRKHSINFGGVVNGRLKLKNNHGGNLAKGIFNRGKKIMRNASNDA